jgi:hypothetical protein
MRNGSDVPLRAPFRLGGQFQFRLEDGATCEIYRLSADSKERLAGESWTDYSRRSCSEVKGNFQRLISQTDFRKEAKKQARVISGHQHEPYRMLSRDRFL